jgi:hypothetical protein
VWKKKRGETGEGVEAKQNMIGRDRKQTLEDERRKTGK